MTVSPVAPDSEALRLAATSGLLVLSLFCANLLLRDRYRRVRLPLALFFLAGAGDLLALPMVYLLEPQAPARITLGFELAEVPLSMVQPFLFWLYVYRLTGTAGATVPRMQLILHLLPIGLASLLYLYCMALPAHALADLSMVPQTPTGVQWVALGGMYAATLAFYLLVPLYAVLILRRLKAYRHRLKDHFASTEGRELAWTRWLTLAVFCFWGVNVMSMAADALISADTITWPVQSLLLAIVVRYGLIWSLALWGLRQAPGLEPPTPRVSAMLTPPQDPPKYERSALASDRLSRIAGKIERLMAQDRLYLQPNLSLWDLADQIGVSTHYASQALNEKLGERFFDYVNRWRVRHAAEQLRTSEATILTIAYDAGFNARSSFYTAFKREYGMTPSAYRESKQTERTAPLAKSH
ncbi:hypothetical protein JANAI62_20370 [Jannaschia pagri]|uniref:HTH araC/xylS-type domain-containing protein n=1 Tax=Jannaschia pagri TaxID=2829797 RepID=A0ABQ4NMG2_9RHOB|nr:MULTISPECIES: helix-turn-helix transcriptional regulator [unclassified Jannaschia]GIT91580.1 hypothetical protein JANAI61_20380 [Jannaschia sp. AI_61]GIT95414.1 hypothetical protein JANAI62_20370 [Jannaschia sp. AI_62]